MLSQSKIRMKIKEFILYWLMGLNQFYTNWTLPGIFNSRESCCCLSLCYKCCLTYLKLRVSGWVKLTSFHWLEIRACISRYFELFPVIYVIPRSSYIQHLRKQSTPPDFISFLCSKGGLLIVRGTLEIVTFVTIFSTCDQLLERNGHGKFKLLMDASGSIKFPQ